MTFALDLRGVVGLFKSFLATRQAGMVGKPPRPGDSWERKKYDVDKD